MFELKYFDTIRRYEQDEESGKLEYPLFDIKDLGVDVQAANALAMEKIAAGQSIDSVSLGASDDIVRFKQRARDTVTDFYTKELLPLAKQRAAERGIELHLSKDDMAGPLMLLGGDEITVSLPRVFEELGLVSNFVKMLQGEPQMRTAFINQVAAPIANKLFDCGLIP